MHRESPATNLIPRRTQAQYRLGLQYVGRKHSPPFLFSELKQPQARHYLLCLGNLKVYNFLQKLQALFYVRKMEQVNSFPSHMLWSLYE